MPRLLGKSFLIQCSHSETKFQVSSMISCVSCSLYKLLLSEQIWKFSFYMNKMIVFLILQYGPQGPYSQYQTKPQYPSQQPLPSPTYGPQPGMRPNGPYPNGQNPYMNQGQYPPTRPNMNGQTYNHYTSSPTQNNFQVRYFYNHAN